MQKLRFRSYGLRLTGWEAFVKRVEASVGCREGGSKPALTLVALVGTAGFEPATSASRTLRATKLRYVPSGSPV
jgi:hypothetical protein